MIRKTIFLFMFLSLFNVAFAGDLFTPVPEDMSVDVLKALFGGMSLFGGGADPLGKLLTAFNSAVLLIGGVLAAYTVLAGIVGTAHDGEMLGRKFSSIWVPIRVALGTSLILPLANGYCGIQVLVMWLVMQGIGLADNLWSTFVSPENLGGVVSAAPVSPSAKELAFNLMMAQVCVKASSLERHKTPELMMPGEAWGATTSSAGGRTVIEFGQMTKGSQYPSDMCGTTTINAIDKPIPTSVKELIFDSASTDRAVKEINRVHQQALNALLSDTGSVASSIVSAASAGSIPQGASTQLEASARKYESTLRSAAASALKDGEPFKKVVEEAPKKGWMLAGAWFLKISELTDRVNEAVLSVPSATSRKSSPDKVFIPDYENTYINAVKASLKGSGYFINNVKELSPAKKGGDEDKDSQSFFEKLGMNVDGSYVINKFFGEKVLNFAISDQEHPLLQVKRLGNLMLGLAGSIFGVGILTVGIVGVPSTALGMMIGGLAMSFIAPLFAGGVFLAYVVPYMPFFMWWGMFAGWVLLVVEAMIASPMWIVMHLNPHGDDWAGSGRKGYGMVVSLMLRPALMIFGLCASIVLLTVLGNFANKIFVEVFLLTTTDNESFLSVMMNVLVTPVIYCAFIYQLVKHCFSIMSHIPDHLLYWFGAEGSSHVSEHANAMSGGTAAVIGAATATASNAIRTPMSGFQGGGKQKNSDDEEMKTSANVVERHGLGADSFLSAVEGNSNVAGSSKIDFMRADAKANKELGGNWMDSYYNNLTDLTKQAQGSVSANDLMKQALVQTYDQKNGNGAYAIKEAMATPQGNNFSNAVSKIADAGRQAGMNSDQQVGLVQEYTSTVIQESGPAVQNKLATGQAFDNNDKFMVREVAADVYQTFKENAQEGNLSFHKFDEQ
nr:DotA/TraY family protein [uncultured Pseudogulbenkiania sp.]